MKHVYALIEMDAVGRCVPKAVFTTISFKLKSIVVTLTPAVCISLSAGKAKLVICFPLTFTLQ